MQRVDWAELSLIFYGGPLALIVTRKNHIKLRRIEKIREFFINEFGVFQTDSETEYRYGKQPISIYNSHGTTIPKKIVQRVMKNYRQGKFLQIKKELEAIYPEIKTIEFKNIWEVFRFIVIRTKHKAIDIDTEKFLPYYRAYNPISIKRLNEVCQEGRKAVESLHPTLKNAIPIAVVIGGSIVALAFMQNAPKWIREAQRYFEDKLTPEGGGMTYFSQYLQSYLEPIIRGEIPFL